MAEKYILDLLALSSLCWIDENAPCSKFDGWDDSLCSLGALKKFERRGLVRTQQRPSGLSGYVLTERGRELKDRWESEIEANPKILIESWKQ